MSVEQAAQNWIRTDAGIDALAAESVRTKIAALECAFVAGAAWYARYINDRESQSAEHLALKNGGR